jgi:tRNA (mo5U34)-methyltransferase
MTTLTMERTAQEIEALRARVLARPWFHIMDLGHGIITPGLDRCEKKKHHYGLPERLDGMSVLDIGAWDGFWSFECERRGAKRVLAADSHCWTRTGKWSKEGFDLAKEALASNVESIVIPVEEMRPEEMGTFDLVLFLGVLYHAQDPMRYLRIVRSLCHSRLILETHVDALDYPRPALVYYPGKTLNNDATNFFGPNPAAVCAMLSDVGFQDVRHHSLFGKNDRAVFHANV